MRKLSKALNFLVLVLALSTAFISCSDSNEARRLGQTIINGNVVVEDTSTKRATEDGFFTLALLYDFFSLTKPASAQSSDGILIVAFQDGAEVDSDTADVQGDFQIAVPRGGDVTLRFETSSFSTSTLITVTPDSEVTLGVALLPLNPPLAEIDAFDILSGPVRTREGEEFRFDEERANLTIDGGGNDCIKATGTSNVNIDVNDLTITNCANGIVGEDFADVSLEAVAVPTLSIEAENNGIHAKDDSSIRLSAVDIFITAGKDGILATGTSDVEVNPSGSCVIEGGDQAVDDRDFAVVNTASCTLT
jgi:hypothetical protein